MPVPPREAEGAFGEFVADPVAAADPVDEVEHLLRVAEPDLVVDVALFREFHGAGDRRPGGDGVEAEVVTEVVRLRDSGKVVDPAVRAEGPDRLVLRALHPLPLDLDVAAALDDAGLAPHLS